MKKLFTLSLLLVLALTVNAQETTYRKSWDFTKWSATTIANLKAEATKGVSGGAWSDIEKATGSAPTELSKDNCFWEVTAQGNASNGSTVMANGEVISELQGLLYTNTTARSLAIAVNYQVANPANSGFGPYNGASYLWLGSSNKNYFVIPHVAPGTTIKMGVESHNTSDARGVQLFVGFGNSGTQLNDPDGNPVATPTTYTDQTWLVPADVTPTHEEDGTVDIQIRNTNGCHLYYITVGDGDAPTTEEAKKVAYLGSEDEFTVGMLDDSKIAATFFNAVPTIEELQENFDALVIGTSATVGQMEGVKDILAFFPIVNTNPDFYKALGLGTAYNIDDQNLTFTSTAISDAGTIETGGISGLALGDYFANDEVLAKVGDVTAIHVHNAGRNAYYFIPVDEATEDLYALLNDVIALAAKTKRAVAAVGTPNITFAQGDGVSTVTISATNSNAIYYTTDGSTPTASSTKYTSPFDVTSECTVKAIATGDGYTDSQVGSKDILIATQLTAPVIDLLYENGKTTIALTQAEGAKIFFNFNGATTAALSQEYKEPIELDEPTTIYALATADNMLPSEVASKVVGIEGVNASNIRLDVVSHFDANEADWFINDATILPNQNGTASAYYFWGKNAWKYYSTEVDHEEIQYAEDGQTPLKSQVDPTKDSVIVYYKVNPDAYKEVVPKTANGWILKSEGQVLTGELTLAPGDGVGNGATGRYAETAIDFMPAGLDNKITKGALTFGGKTSGEPYTARVETTDKIAGPFDVVVFCGNGNSGSKPVMEIQTSTDGEEWTKLSELNLSGTQRYVKRTRASYNESEPVYVRVTQTATASKAQVYDIYILNNGTKSQAYDAVTAIQDVKKAKVAAGIYSIGGVRLQSLQRGINIVVDENGVAKKVVK